MDTKIQKYYLGCVPDEVDERDNEYAFEKMTGKAKAVRPSFKDGYDAIEANKVPLDDDPQGNSYGCVAHGGTDDVETTYFIAAGRKIHLSRRDAYSQIFLAGGGASPRDFYKLANKKGICEDNFLPTYQQNEELSENWLRYRKDATEENIKNAEKYKIGAYRAIQSLDIEVMAQAIFENYGCGGGYMPCDGSMGHFIFPIGYGIKKDCYALKYKDSYSPFYKWIVLKNNKYYLDSPFGLQVKLFSFWTCEPNKDWQLQNMKERIIIIEGLLKGQQFSLYPNNDIRKIPDEETLHFLIKEGVLSDNMIEVKDIGGYNLLKDDYPSIVICNKLKELMPLLLDAFESITNSKDMGNNIDKTWWENIKNLFDK